MQSSILTETTWYLIAKEPEQGIPPRIAVTPPFRIGRREGFDLCLSCRNVSGLHAEIIQEHGQFWIDDLNSTNGTFVNGAKIRKKTSLKNGDVLQFGQSAFTIACVGNTDSTSPSMLEDGSPIPAPETTEERFERLLEGGVVPFFQPIFDITGDENRKIGYEVLGRSRLFGLKTPDQMFAIATDLEKESELSSVLRMRGVEAAESCLSEDMVLFVNTHPAELDCNEIQQSLELIRQRYPSRPIMLELPERVLYTPETYGAMIESVKQLNIQLAMHDFGAGQIQLAELANLSPDIVKFDGALIQGIDQADEKRQSLVSATVTLVKQLGITPMAEFVETEGEHETLKQMGFELVQGYHYGHPGSFEDVTGGDEVAARLAELNRRPEERPLDVLKRAEDLQEAVTSELNKVSLSVAVEEAPVSDPVTAASANWLLEQDDSQFTIQLMFCAKQDQAKSFVSERTQAGEYAIYRKWSSNREWFVVVFGIFDSRETAQLAAEQFSETGHSSWVRRLTDVKDEINSVEHQ